MLQVPSDEDGGPTAEQQNQVICELRGGIYDALPDWTHPLHTRQEVLHSACGFAQGMVFKLYKLSTGLAVVSCTVY